MRTLRKEQSVSDLNSAEAAAYMAEMAGSLAVMARRHGLDTLAYLFDMAREESQNNTHLSDSQSGRSVPHGNGA